MLYIVSQEASAEGEPLRNTPVLCASIVQEVSITLLMDFNTNRTHGMVVPQDDPQPNLEVNLLKVNLNE